MNKKMTRRDFIQFAAAAGVVSLTPMTGYAREDGDRPNVIIFYLDDSGYVLRAELWSDAVPLLCRIGIVVSSADTM
jgi:hypothetical protein